jgi:hypothetical protein
MAERKKASVSKEGKRISEHLDAIFEGEGKYYNEIAKMLGGKDIADNVKQTFDTPEARRDLFEFLYIYGGSKKAYSELKGIFNSAEGPEAVIKEVEARIGKLGEAGITTEKVMAKRGDKEGRQLLADLNANVKYKEAIAAYGSPEWGTYGKAKEAEPKAVAAKEEPTAISLVEAKVPKTLEPELDKRKDIAEVTGRGGQGVTVSSDGKYANINVFGKMVDIGYIPNTRITDAYTKASVSEDKERRTTTTVNETYLRFEKKNEVSGKVETSVAYVKAEETEKPRLLGIFGKDRQQTVTIKFEDATGNVSQIKNDITGKPIVLEGSMKNMPIAAQIRTKEGSFNITG